MKANAKAFGDLRLVRGLKPGFVVGRRLRLQPGWRWRPGGRGLLSVAAARAETQAALRRAERTARACTWVIGLSLVAGFGLGYLVEPPQPWVGLAVAALVIGGVPSLLLASVLRDAARLRQALRDLQTG